MRNSVILPQSNDDGKLLENAIYLHLRRYTDPSQKISYFYEGYECDFVIQCEEHTDALIQVCWTLCDIETRNRELRGLKTASEITGCRNCTIVTFDEEAELDYFGLKVKVVPAWKWLGKAIINR